MTKEKYTIHIHEKGSIEEVEHALRCTEEAEKRANKDWLKKACSSRREMLLHQLLQMKGKQ